MFVCQLLLRVPPFGLGGGRFCRAFAGGVGGLGVSARLPGPEGSSASLYNVQSEAAVKGSLQCESQNVRSLLKGDLKVAIHLDGNLRPSVSL